MVFTLLGGLVTMLFVGFVILVALFVCFNGILIVLLGCVGLWFCGLVCLHWLRARYFTLTGCWLLIDWIVD